MDQLSDLVDGHHHRAHGAARHRPDRAAVLRPVQPHPGHPRGPPRHRRHRALRRLRPGPGAGPAAAVGHPQTGAVVGLLALVVIFQPELRRGLERIGRVGSLGWAFAPSGAAGLAEGVARTLARTAAALSAHAHRGAHRHRARDGPRGHRRDRRDAPRRPDRGAAGVHLRARARRSTTARSSSAAAGSSPRAPCCRCRRSRSSASGTAPGTGRPSASRSRPMRWSSWSARRPAAISLVRARPGPARPGRGAAADGAGGVAAADRRRAAGPRPASRRWARRSCAASGRGCLRRRAIGAAGSPRPAAARRRRAVDAGRGRRPAPDGRVRCRPPRDCAGRPMPAAPRSRGRSRVRRAARLPAAQLAAQAGSHRPRDGAVRGRVAVRERAHLARRGAHRGARPAAGRGRAGPARLGDRRSATGRPSRWPASSTNGSFLASIDLARRHARPRAARRSGAGPGHRRSTPGSRSSTTSPGRSTCASTRSSSRPMTVTVDRGTVPDGLDARAARR